ncbi:MAG: hypothetical protein ACTSPV_14455 [Candidatus Hodarchaeales archaeon]
MLKYFMRGPIRKVIVFLTSHDDFQISPKGVLDALTRVSKTCKADYEQIQERLRTVVNWVYVDETGFHVNGQKWWVFAFSIIVIRIGFCYAIIFPFFFPQLPEIFFTEITNMLLSDVTEKQII